MPYIKQKDRPQFKEGLESLIENMETPGDLNYLYTKLAHAYKDKKGICYETLNAISGVFSCADKEFYRKVVVPYEEKKIKENGDIE
jgi:hypothetical protein